jgi:hypothetical protein
LLGQYNLTNHLHPLQVGPWRGLKENKMVTFSKNGGMFFDIEEIELGEKLIDEYRKSIKHGFNDIFGYNARRETDKIVDKLYELGITEYNDIFGTVKIQKWAY